MSKWISTVIVGIASGATTAYFLSSEKGKEVKNRAMKAYQAYRKHPESYHQKAKEKAYEYSNLAVDTFYDYKEKFESGELTKEDVVSVVKEKSDEVVSKASDVIEYIKSKVHAVAEEEKEVVATEDVKAEVDDIVIDLKDVKVDKAKAITKMSKDTTLETTKD